LRVESLLLAALSFLGILDTSVMIPSLAPYAVSLGASEAVAGLVVAVYSYVAVFASVAAGVLVDVFGRRRSLALGLASDGAVMALYSLARSPMDLLVLRALHAVGGSLVYPAAYSRAAGSGARPSAARLSLALSATALAVALGIAAGGVLPAVIGFQGLYRLVAALLLLGALLALLLPRDPPGRPPREALARVARGLRIGLPAVAGGSLSIMAAYIGLGAAAGGLATALLAEGLAAGEEEASMKAGIAMGAAVIVSSVAIALLGLAAERLGPAAPALAGLLGSLAVALLSALDPAGYAALLVASSGVALGGLMLASTLLVVSTPPESRGTAVGVQQVFNILGAGVGAAVGGALSGSHGLQAVLAVIAAAGVASSLIALAASARASWSPAGPGSPRGQPLSGSTRA